MEFSFLAFSADFLKILPQDLLAVLIAQNNFYI